MKQVLLTFAAGYGGPGVHHPGIYPIWVLCAYVCGCINKYQAFGSAFWTNQRVRGSFEFEAGVVVPWRRIGRGGNHYVEVQGQLPHAWELLANVK